MRNDAKCSHFTLASGVFAVVIGIGGVVGFGGGGGRRQGQLGRRSKSVSRGGGARSALRHRRRRLLKGTVDKSLLRANEIWPFPPISQRFGGLIVAEGN